MHSLPKIDARYWIALCAASVFGTNTGDFVAHKFHIGHIQGLAPLIALLLVVLWLDRRVPLRAPLWFWAAIITVRTAATNVGDGFHQFKLGFDVSLPVTTVLFVAAVLFYRRRGGGVGADGTLRVDWVYWTCMMLAGAWGTVAGDFAADAMVNPPLEPAWATLVLCVPVVLAFLGGGKGRLLHPLYYWTAIGLIRAAGTCAGDATADALGHNITGATLLTGAVFIGLIVLFYVVFPQRAQTDRVA